MIDLTARATIAQGEALAVMQQIPDSSIAAVITDPPYSSGGFTRSDRMSSTTNKYVLTGTLIDRPDFAGDNRDQRGYLKWCIAWLDEALRITRPGGSLLMFTDWRQLPTTTDAVQCGGWIWRGIVPWDKGEGTRPRRGALLEGRRFLGVEKVAAYVEIARRRLADVEHAPTLFDDGSEALALDLEFPDVAELDEEPA